MSFFTLKVLQDQKRGVSTVNWDEFNHLDFANVLGQSLDL